MFDRKAYMREYSKTYAPVYREKNREKINEHVRRYAQRHPEKIRANNAKKEYYPLRYAWVERNPEKAKAHGLVAYALKTGKLTKPSVCSDCFREIKPQAHHPDYSKPLEVIWLCPQCHANVHVLKRKERVAS